MNREHIRRARELLGRARNKPTPWKPWTWVNLAAAEFVPQGMLRAAKNDRYVVQFYRRATAMGIVDWMMIQSIDGAPVRSWADFQRIKNELCGPEREAVEIYPPQSELVNDCNVYHLWVLPAGQRVGFGMRYGEGVAK